MSFEGGLNETENDRLRRAVERLMDGQREVLIGCMKAGRDEAPKIRRGAA